MQAEDIPFFEARYGSLDASVEIVPENPRRFWGDSGRVQFHELARKLQEFDVPIECPAEGSDPRTGSPIHVSTVGRWLFGVPGYEGNVRFSIPPDAPVPGSYPKSILLHYPSRAPNLVRLLVHAIRVAVEKEQSQQPTTIVVEGGAHLTSTPKEKVFVSHSTADRGFVENEILPLLKSRGIDAWYCKTEIQTASQWERGILEGLKSCNWFLVVMSARSASSEWVKDEVHWAVENRPERVIPVMISDCDPYDFHVRLARMQHVDFRSDRNNAREKLLTVFIPESGQHVSEGAPTSDSHHFSRSLCNAFKLFVQSLEPVTENYTSRMFKAKIEKLTPPKIIEAEKKNPILRWIDTLDDELLEITLAIREYWRDRDCRTGFPVQEL